MTDDERPCINDFAELRRQLDRQHQAIYSLTVWVGSVSAIVLTVVIFLANYLTRGLGN